MNRILPSGVTVLGVDYDIVECSTKEGAARGSPAASVAPTVWGTADLRDHAMYLYAPEGMAPLVVFRTFLHELIHVIAHEGCIEPLVQWTHGDVREHAALEQVARILADTLVRNGLVVLPSEVE